MTPDTTLAANLEAVLTKLSPGDRRFADSLLAGFKRYRSFTDRQRPHVERLIDAAHNPKPQPAARGGLKPIIDLFRQAKGKRAKVWLRLKDGTDVRINMAGQAARMPGTLNVTDGGGFGEGRWFGRIGLDGTWQTSPREVEPATLFAALTCLATDPVGTIAAHGHRTSHCSFCDLPLTDERSLAAGYGETCAKRWGLPWGVARKVTLPVEAPNPPAKETKRNPVRQGRVSPLLSKSAA